MSERDLQVQVADYLDVNGYIWLHVPNGIRSSAYHAKKMLVEGLKPGAPDVLIFNQVDDYNGLAIELKAGSNSYMKPNQKHWLELLRTCGWFVACCRDFGSVEFLVDNYIDGNHKVLPDLKKHFYFTLKSE